MNIGIVGLGLMGGSFGRTLYTKGGFKVYGEDLSDSAFLKAELLHAVSEKLDEKSAAKLDMLILAVTPDKVESILEKYLPHLKKGAVVTDFCGIKRGVVKTMKAFSEKYKDIIFVGGHPMAGREFSGIDHSTATLFEGASMILVNVNADIFKLEELKKFYLSLGFKNVEICSAERHDEEIAFTSQLCHVLSNAFIKNKSAESHDGFSAGSYKDMTRVARLNPQMWTELMTENADNLSSELSELIDNLNKYLSALKNKDSETLYKLLYEGNERKLYLDVKGKK